MNPFDFIKGGDIIEELITSSLPSLNNISFVKLSDFPPDRHRDFWSSIDCLLVPSRADNSPNVIHEAKEFDVPVIASDAGGIPELLSSFVDVIIPSTDLSPESVLEAIFFTRQRNISRKDFTASYQVFKSYVRGTVEKLKDIYSQLLIS
jgi:glycosyltransferase involved in cell wall biosynthesis